MSHPIRSLPRRGLAVALVTVAFSASLHGAPRIYMIREDRIVLRVRVPAAGADGEAVREILLVGEGPQRATWELAWPTAESRCHLTLEARREPSAADTPQRVHLAAELDRPGRDQLRAERDLAFHDTTLAFFEVGREGPRSLTLAVEAAHTVEDVPSASPVVGAPVVLALEIQSLEAGDAISLETNRLHTFVGEPVSYSFHFGEGQEIVSLEIRLRPLELSGDVARVEIEVTGLLGALVVSRREQWVTTREATSTLDIVEGEPPAGYRFLVTPRF